MHVGEGPRIAGGLAGLIGIAALFVWAAVRADRQLRDKIERWPEDNSEPCSDYDGD